jgi:6-phosphogluconolactonase
MKSWSLSRRDFLEGLGWSSLSGVASRLAWISGPSAARQPRFAYVSSLGDANQDHGLHVFSVERGHWRKVQTIASERPVFLALHPNQQSLYVVNEIDSYRNLPSGSVESFAIDSVTGHLTLLNRQALSLSATSPRHLAVTPDASSVVVASHGGGAYNLLPIAANGALERVSSIVKETGASLHEEHQTSAHPQMVLFDPAGRMLTADLGSDRLNVFSLDGAQISATHRSGVKDGAGPRQMALHPDGQRLFVANGLEGSVSCYRYDTASGRIGARLSHTSFSSKESAVMAMHPTGRVLYTAPQSSSEGIRAWSIASSGDLTPLRSLSRDTHGVHAMTISPEGSSMILAARDRDRILRLELDPSSGHVQSIDPVAQVAAPVSVALKYV